MCVTGDVPAKIVIGYMNYYNYLVQEYDSCELVRKYKGPKLDILVDQGTGDEFLERELLSDHFQRACADVGMPLNLRMQKVSKPYDFHRYILHLIKYHSL